MKKYIYVLVTILLLSSCKPSPKVIQYAISQTQTAEITPTQTQIPIEEIDLSKIIYQEYDLPAGYSPAQIRENGYGDLNMTPLNNISLQLEQQGKGAGIFSIDLFDTSNTALEVFRYLKVMTGSDKNDSINHAYIDPNLGNDSRIFVYRPKTEPFSIPPSASEIRSLFFQRCKAIVVAKLSNTKDIEGILAYATKIDNRLRDLICQDE